MDRKLFIFLVIGIFSFFNLMKTEQSYSVEKTSTYNASVVHWNYGSYIHAENKNVSFGLEIFSPIKPGKYPLVIFLTGLDGIAPGFIYKDFSEQLAQESNSIVIIFNDIRPPSLPNKEELLFERTLNWTIQNLDGLFNDKRTPDVVKGKVFGDVDTFGVTLMGHSAAGHPLVSYLNKTCGLVKSLILMDPVDGFDPFGIIKIFVTNPPNQLPFNIPTAFLSSGYGAVQKGRGPACAPKNFSNVRFYDSLHGPTWYLNFTDYGHGDVLDDFGRIYGANLICKTCPEDCDFPGYRKNIAKAASYFLLALREKNEKYLEALENPRGSQMYDSNMNIKSFYKYNGFDVLSSGPFCSHS